MQQFDLATRSVRDLNQALHRLSKDSNETYWRVANAGGQHSLAVGIDAPVTVEIDGHVGYYCAGMNKEATVIVHGNAGVGCAENMMSGRVHVKGDVSQAAGATAHGGLLIVDGNASARCGISLKGADIVVKGDIGPMSAFMAQAGNIVVLGQAGEALGDSLYETRIFVRGEVKSLGADCIEKPLGAEEKSILAALLKQAEIDPKISPDDFRFYGSARRLYHFNVDHADEY
jgi:glutamate synthase domain-containing protein 3